MKFLPILFCFLIAGGRSLACPVLPSFRDNVLNNEYIVEGRVIELLLSKHDHPADPSAPFMVDSARVVITEKIKGGISRDTIEIAGMFLDMEDLNKVCIAFLRRSEGRYFISSLKNGEPLELGIYKQRTIELVAISKLTDTLKRYQQTAEWMVRCAENRITREAMTDLGYYNNTVVICPINQRSRFNRKIEYFPLADYQLTRLRAIALSLDELKEGDYDLLLLALVQQPEDMEMKNFLVKNLAKAADGDQLMAMTLMEHLLNYNNKQGALLSIYKQAEDLHSYKKEEIKTLIAEFITEIKKK